MTTSGTAPPRCSPLWRPPHREGHQRLLPRHRQLEFLAFLRQVAKAYPRPRLHIVTDNDGTHEHADVRYWLAKNPRVTLHFTPASASWRNLVGIFFGRRMISVLQAVTPTAHAWRCCDHFDHLFLASASMKLASRVIPFVISSSDR
jgi:DDE superfamily endonuclease